MTTLLQYCIFIPQNICGRILWVTLKSFFCEGCQRNSSILKPFIKSFFKASCPSFCKGFSCSRDCTVHIVHKAFNQPNGFWISFWFFGCCNFWGLLCKASLNPAVRVFAHATAQCTLCAQCTRPSISQTAAKLTHFAELPLFTPQKWKWP